MTRSLAPADEVVWYPGTNFTARARLPEAFRPLLRHTGAMMHGRISAGHGTRLMALGRTAPYVALAVTLGSLYVVWLNQPGTPQVVGALVVLGCSVVAVALRRFRPALILLPAVAGGVAVAFTSREYFSFWPAACVLLVTAAVAESGRRSTSVPFVAATAAAAGLAVAAIGPDAEVAMLPVAVAAVAVVMVRLAASWMARARELEMRAAEYQHRAEVSEAANLELERRTVLARELHDSLGHHVSAIVVRAEAGRVAHPNEALATIADLGREALDELEAVLFDLRAPSAEAIGPTEVDLGRIDSKLARPLRQYGVNVHVDVSTEETDPARLSATYRIVQEALTNTLRHAAATAASVVIRDEGGDLVVLVQDDGVGLPAESPVGSGLSGIRERAMQFGGEAQIVTAQPRGTLVQVRIPRTDP